MKFRIVKKVPRHFPSKHLLLRKPSNHFLISGVGRSGTTFLVTLLTHLGLDTGFRVNDLSKAIDKNSGGGLEFSLHKPWRCPYIVKNPWFCTQADFLLQQNEFSVDHVLIPIRELRAAAESRRTASKNDSAQGGLWMTDSFEKGVQENVLTENLYNLIYYLTLHDIPFSFVEYPRLINDAEYLYSKISFLLNDISFKQFEKKFNLARNPKWIHDYTEKEIHD